MAESVPDSNCAHCSIRLDSRYIQTTFKQVLDEFAGPGANIRDLLPGAGTNMI
jgi:hypothetical protein